MLQTGKVPASEQVRINADILFVAAGVEELVAIFVFRKRVYSDLQGVQPSVVKKSWSKIVHFRQQPV